VGKSAEHARVLKWMHDWVEAKLSDNGVTREEGTALLRIVAWTTVLDKVLAMQLVVLMEHSRISPKMVNQADRLLAASVFTKELSEEIKWYLVSRILAIAPRLRQDRLSDDIIEYIALLDDNNPFTRLVRTYAGIRGESKNKKSNMLGALVWCLALAPWLVLVLSVFGTIGTLLKPYIGGGSTLLCWAILILLRRKRNVLLQPWFNRYLGPVNLSFAWAGVWISGYGIHLSFFVLNLPDILSWTLCMVVTFGGIGIFGLTRHYLSRAVGNEGWRSFIPPWEELAARQMRSSVTSQHSRNILFIFSWTWAIILMFGVAVALNVSNDLHNPIVNLLVLIGPVSLLGIFSTLGF